MKSKKLQGIFGETFILVLLFSTVFHLQKPVSQIFFNLFCSGDNSDSDSEISQNCIEKQIMPSKTTVNWLFNDTCYFSRKHAIHPKYNLWTLRKNDSSTPRNIPENTNEHTRDYFHHVSLPICLR